MPHAATAGGGGPANVPDRVTRANLLIFTTSLLVSAVLALVLAARESTPWWTVTAVLIAFTVVGWLIALRWRVPRSFGAGLLLLAVINFFFFVPELGLRIAGFTYVSGVQFGFPTPQELWYLEPDEELLWRFPSEHPLVNSLGFIGGEPAVPKPPGTFRIVFLGDSCTFQGEGDAYPTLVEHALNRLTPGPVEAINMGVAGYTSHQGRVVAERYGALLEPDLVLVYFGWNDHWLAYGAIDAEKSVAIGAERVYRSSRLLQALRRVSVSSGLGSRAQPLDATRVPLDQYRQNLEGMLTLFREMEVPVVFLTAPTAHYRYGVPDYLVDEGFAIDADTVTELHRQYNQAVREAARGSGARLLDTEQAFDQLADSRALFTEDGIHLTAEGRRAMARGIVTFLIGAGLVPS